jgi:dihydroorotase
MKKILIKKGLLVDPSQNLKAEKDLLIEGGVIKEIKEEIKPSPEMEVLDAKNCVVAPAFIDLHAHLRDPGYTYKEDIYTAGKSAVFGGFTTLVSMPNTNPTADNPTVIEYQIQKAKKEGLIRLIPAGAITKDRKGKELTNFQELKKAGVKALSDDGTTPSDENLLKIAFQWSSDLDLLIMDHAEIPSLSKEGVINEGKISSILGVEGRSFIAETIALARDGYLAMETNARVHIQHITSKESIKLLEFFKEKGVKITAEVNPNHLIFTEEAVLKYGSLAKVNPPFRTEEDRLSLIKALEEGLIDCIGTDHAPHSAKEKGIYSSEILEKINTPFHKEIVENLLYSLKSAPPGLLGLPVALSILIKLMHEGFLSLNRIIEVLSTTPAKILGLYPELGSLKIGTKADIVIFDPKKEWLFTPEINPSKSENSPLINTLLIGKVIYTIKEGKIVYKEKKS